MAALELAETTVPTDNRRITEHDPAMARLKARTARQLAASIQQLVDDLKAGVQPVQAQSHFIDRHLSILRAAYLAAHTEGQRDYYDAVSNTPQKWANHEADTATMQRRMAFYAPSVAKMAHEAVRAFQTVTHESAQLDDNDAAADGDEAVILYNPYPRQAGGRFGFGSGIAHGGGSHGESQHAGAGHVGEHVGAARGEHSYGGLGFHRSGGAGGGAEGASRGAAKVSRSQKRRKEQRAAAAAAKAAKRAANAKAGLANSGRPHSYPGYVRAHNAAEARGDKAMVAKLEKLYPQHEAERKSYHEQLGGHNRQALSQRRVATAKREDIISHDYRIKTYAEYQGVAKYHALHGNEDVLSALGTHRSLWLKNRGADPARLYTQRQQAWRAYDQMMAQHERDTALSERPRRRSTSKAKVLSA